MIRMRPWIKKLYPAYRARRKYRNTTTIVPNTGHSSVRRPLTTVASNKVMVHFTLNVADGSMYPW